MEERLIYSRSVRVRGRGSSGVETGSRSRSARRRSLGGGGFGYGLRITAEDYVKTRILLVPGALLLLAGVIAARPQQSPAPSGAPAQRWYKGNTHTHTLNSDGDSTPDEVVRWYREHGYQFLVLTDHNYLTSVDGLNALHGAAEKFLVVRGEEVTSTRQLQGGAHQRAERLVAGRGTLRHESRGGDAAERRPHSQGGRRAAHQPSQFHVGDDCRGAGSGPAHPPVRDLQRPPAGQ